MKVRWGKILKTLRLDTSKTNRPVGLKLHENRYSICPHIQHSKGGGGGEGEISWCCCFVVTHSQDSTAGLYLKTIEYRICESLFKCIMMVQNIYKVFPLVASFDLLSTLIVMRKCYICSLHPLLCTGITTVLLERVKTLWCIFSIS